MDREGFGREGVTRQSDAFQIEVFDTRSRSYRDGLRRQSAAIELWARFVRGR